MIQAKLEVPVETFKKVKTGEVVSLKPEVNYLTFDIKVLKEKTAYGRKHYLVTPSRGEGEVWVRNILIVKPKLKVIT